MRRVSKIIEYRSARWYEVQNDLASMVQSAWSMFPTHLDRTIAGAEQSSTCGLTLVPQIPGGGVFIHCGRYVDKQGVGVLPMAPAPSVALGERDPGENENFVRSDFMAFIKGNNVITYNCGRGAGGLRNYLAALFEKAGCDEASRAFELVRMADPDKVARISSVGVKRIELKVALSEAEAASVSEQVAPQGVMAKAKQGLIDFVRAVGEADESIDKLRGAHYAVLGLSIDVPRNDIEAARSGFDKMAEEITQDSEAGDYVIYLRDGVTTIRGDEVALTRRVNVHPVANSVSPTEMMDAMNSYLASLV